MDLFHPSCAGLKAPDITGTFLGIEKDECEIPSACGAAAGCALHRDSRSV